MCAAIINGLVAPVLIRESLKTEESAKQILHAILFNNGMLGQTLTKVFVIASSLAVVFWSITILKLSRFAQAIGIIGCVVGALSLVAFLSGHLRLNVHGLGLFVFAQSIWIILVGVFMYRASD